MSFYGEKNETDEQAIIDAIEDSGGGGTSDVNITQVGGVATSLGQKTMAASIPVVLPSDQTINLNVGDIEIGAVELKNATTDDRVAVINSAPTTEFGVVTRNIPSGTQAVSGTFFQATQPVSIAGAIAVTGPLTDTQLRATPVPVSGTVTSLPSGTQNVDVVANTIGLATAAKQDTLLTELQLKADLTETQPVSLASVPSHPVTNAGTFAVQAAQSGTWTVQPGNTANTTAWKVDGSAVTQPVSGTFFQATQPVSIAGLPAMTNTQLDIGTSQVATPTSNLASRKTISIKALAANAQKVYVGLTGVSSSNGYELSAGDSIEIDCDATVNLFTIAASGTQRISIIEVA